MGVHRNIVVDADHHQPRPISTEVPRGSDQSPHAQIPACSPPFASTRQCLRANADLQSLHRDVEYKDGHLFALMASFGAVSTMLFAAPTSQLVQPRNVVGGHIISVRFRPTISLDPRFVLGQSFRFGAAAHAALGLTKSLTCYSFVLY